MQPRPGTLRSALPGKAAMLVGGALLALVLVESALRIAGWTYDLAPTVEFGWPDPTTLRSRYEPDADLFWVTKDYRDKLRAAERSHPQVIFLGDSCTEFGTYPARTLAHLANPSGGGAPSGIHLANGGWSSEQGLAQLERDVVPLRPRIIVIFFGWNDHWIAFGPSDPELRLAHRLLSVTEHLRLAQLALETRIALAHLGTDAPLRVPPERYLSNLEDMARLARAGGIVPILVTAPSNHVPGHEPDYLAERHLRRLSDLVPLHQEYVALTRRAAEETQTALCDAAAEFAGFGAARDKLFRSDGIHFTDAGDEQLAEIVSRCILAASPR